jgi:hypothetical protein
VRRSAIESQRWRSRAVLQGAKAARSERTRGDGGHRTFALVRAVTGGAGFRGVDWGWRGVQEIARPEAENPSRGRSTLAEATAGKSLSWNLDTECRESGSAATALAPASAGADADTGHESAPGRGDERRLSLEEKAVQRKGTSTAGVASARSLGQSASERITGAAGLAGSQDRGVNGSPRAKSQETTRGAAINDVSWGGTHHRAGLLSGHRDTRSVSLWQAAWQLHRAHSVRGLQRRPSRVATAIAGLDDSG